MLKIRKAMRFMYRKYYYQLFALLFLCILVAIGAIACIRQEWIDRYGSTAESTQEQTDLITDQPIENSKETTIETTIEATEASSELTTEVSTEESSEKSTEESTEVTTEESSEETTEETTEESSEEATEESTEESTEETSDESTEESSEETTQEPTEESSEQTSVETSIEVPTQKEIPLSTDYLRYLGRTTLQREMIYLVQSGSGVSFRFHGQKLELTFRADSAFFSYPAKFGVYVYDTLYQTFLVDEVEKTVTIEFNSTVYVNISIVKLSEGLYSTVGLKKIVVAEDAEVSPTTPAAYRIEFIGDSITCGYGIEDENRKHHFSTTTENFTKTYAYKVAQYFHADYSMFCMSGYGVISGTTLDPNYKRDDLVIGPLYETLGVSYGVLNGNLSPQNIAWENGSGADLVVINLGTNDSTYCRNDAAKQAEFSQAYVELIKQVRKANPNAQIICTLGIMGQELGKAVDTACTNYIEETGDTRVCYLALPSQDGTLGYAADGHPTEKTNELAAEVLIEKIQSLMGWLH